MNRFLIALAFVICAVTTLRAQGFAPQAPPAPIRTDGVYSSYYGGYYNPCSGDIPMRMWPHACMGELKFDTGKLKQWKAEDIDVRIDGDNKGPVSKHDNKWDDPITLAPSDIALSAGQAPHRYHIEIVAKGSTVVLFEDYITVPSLLQSGYKPSIFHVSDDDFTNSPLTAEVTKEHRQIRASDLIIRK